MEISSLKLRHVAKTIGLPLLYFSGGVWLANALAGRHRRIALTYHGIAGDRFAEHVAYLQQHTRIVSLDRFLVDDGRASGPPTVTITFDDGCASFVDEILPVVTASRMPVAWFVPTAHVDTHELFWFHRLRAQVMHTRRDVVECNGMRWRLEDWNRPYAASAVSQWLKQQPPVARAAYLSNLTEQLGEAPAQVLRRYQSASRVQLLSIDPTLVTIGSHSHTHPLLSDLDADALSTEVTISKQLLEQWTQRQVRHFSFPSGDYNEATISAVRKAGYVSAWSTEPRFLAGHEDVYRMPRMLIDDQASVSVLAAKTAAVVNRWSAR